VTLRSHTEVEKPDQSITIELSEPVSLTFSLKYLVNFCKAAGLSNQVKICLSNEVPLLVEYGLTGNSYLRFYLAPKVRGIPFLCVPLSYSVTFLLSISNSSLSRYRLARMNERIIDNDERRVLVRQKGLRRYQVWSCGKLGTKCLEAGLASEGPSRHSWGLIFRRGRSDTLHDNEDLISSIYHVPSAPDPVLRNPYLSMYLFVSLW